MPNAETDVRELIAQGLGPVLAEHVGGAVQVTGLHRLTGGSSNETWAFDLIVEKDRSAIPLILRRSFVSGPLEMRLDVEFRLLQSLQQTGLPIPTPWVCLTEGSPIGSPFMVMNRAPGTDVRKVLASGTSAATREQLADELVAVLAGLHAVDWRRKCPGALEAPSENVALHEIARWAPVVESSASDNPLLMSVLWWLRTNAPANDHLSLVHGDYKANNILHGEGRTQAVIDWELTHIGDPYEDLAWTLLWDTRFDIVNGLLPESEFLQRYAQKAGISVDQGRLRFWRIFSLMKLTSIFLSGLSTASTATPLRPMLLQLARAIPVLEERMAGLLIEALGKSERAA